MDSEQGNEAQSSEAASEINVIEATPGFILPDKDGRFLRDTNRPEYDRLEGERDAAYRQASEQTPVEAPDVTPESTVAKAQRDIEQLQAAGLSGDALTEQLLVTSAVDLSAEARADLEAAVDTELGILANDFGYERPDIGDDLDAAHLRTFKMFRLAEQGESFELPIMLEKELVSLGADDSALALFRHYKASADLNPELRRDVAILACKYVQQGHKNRRAALAESQT